MQEKLVTYYRRTPRVGKHILFWLAFISFFAVLWGSFNDDYFHQFELQLLYLPEKLLATYITLYILLPSFLLKEKYILFFFWVAIVLLIAGLIHWLTAYYIERPIYYRYDDWGSVWHPAKVLKSATHIYPVVVLATMIKFFEHWYRNQQATQNLAKEKLEAELKFLRAQVHPHFLFNTLNNLYALALKKADNTPEVVLKLSDLLNYMLYECNTDQAPLDKEIKLVENYVALEKLRYGDRLDVSMRVKGDISGKVIAPMLVLPFVENSFKHGTSSETEKAWISIDLTVKGNLLTLKVDNSKSNHETDDEKQYREGIGLKNVKRRLELLYGGSYELKILDTDESYLVVLKLELNE
ncbi:putative two-component system sensor protein [Fulvivirga imtechensis AK7]|uniref:Putative two-component system sensor protein n=1 Tax=Fulvivirga imtechensis AK7 TaxID=1237149 RepID=L8JRS2_9BACT|nr:histidine kinase [Fulvivirga imtechensis]ELR70179.1 putative two-component system sensor protein [Fulvivirga imtechensis AK7]